MCTLMTRCTNLVLNYSKWVRRTSEDHLVIEAGRSKSTKNDYSVSEKNISAFVWSLTTLQPHSDEHGRPPDTGTVEETS